MGPASVKQGETIKRTKANRCCICNASRASPWHMRGVRWPHHLFSRSGQEGGRLVSLTLSGVCIRKTLDNRPATQHHAASPLPLSLPSASRQHAAVPRRNRKTSLGYTGPMASVSQDVTASSSRAVTCRVLFGLRVGLSAHAHARWRCCTRRSKPWGPPSVMPRARLPLPPTPRPRRGTPSLRAAGGREGGRRRPLRVNSAHHAAKEMTMVRDQGRQSL